MAIVVNKRPSTRNWSGNPIHYLLYSADAEADPTNYFEIKFKRTDAAAYVDVITLPYKPVSGSAKIDIQDILDGLMEFELPFLPSDTSFPSPQFFQKATGLFYIEFREILTEDLDPDWDDSEDANPLFVIKGGISFEKWRGDNFWVNYFDNIKPFLSWQKNQALHSYNELMWLYWLNLTDDDPAQIKLQQTVKFTDASENVQFLDIGVPINNIAAIPAGAVQLRLGEIEISKSIYYWELQVVKVSTNPIEPLSEPFRYYLDNNHDKNDITLHYRSSLGGLDSLRVRGVIESNSQREFSQTERIVLHDYFSGHYVNGRVAADNSTELLTYKGNTGPLGKEEQDRIRDLHLKREVWQAKQEKWLPVMMLSTSQRFRISTDSRFGMPLEWCIASGGNYYYTPETVNLQEGNTSTGLVCTAVISPLSMSYTAGVGWLIDWSLVSGTPNKYFVSTPGVSGGAPGETITTQYLYSWLPVGNNEITVQPLCLIGGVYFLGAVQTISVTVAAACQVVAISSAPVYLPDAVEDVPYNFVINLTGTAPFSVANIVKPAWMSIAIAGSSVVISGTPAGGDIGTDIDVSFDLENCSGSTISYADTIDVLAAAGNGDFILTNDATGLNYIKNVVPLGFYSISSGSLPVLAGETTSGVLATAIATPISVLVIIASTVGHSIQLFKNGTLQEEIETPGSGLYSFAAVSFAVTDNMEIKLIYS